ncbi:YSIRK-type signal peptide-containing protein, partial [uncultured Streptococcus sp.]|uniref:YSIRK-type signal peptide-containing protein n=1 Tax=uncultured Streptococcus sp. TaxID=83427 RepID=UPI0032119E88
MKFEKHQKFSIRKFSVGVASVLIGQFFIGAVSNAPVVRASEVIGVHAENQNVPAGEVVQPKVEATTVDTDTNHLVSTPKLDLTEAQSAEVEYKADDSIELGKRNEVITSTGKKIITIGTKPTTVVEEIPPIITYQEDKELEGGTTREESLDSTHNGKISTLTHTYKVNSTTGEVTDIQSEPVLTDSGKKGKIIHVGTKKAIHTEPVNNTLYVADETVPGTEMPSLSYRMDWYERISEIEYEYDNVSHRAVEKAKKFVKMEHVQRVIGYSEPIREVVDKYPIEIVKVPAGSTVESRDEIMKYHYIPNPKLESGEKIVSKNGKPLIIEERNFYTIAPLDGHQIITKKIIKKQELEYGIIEIGVKPKVVYKDVPIKIQKGNELIDTGKKFTVKATITYTIPTDFETSGKLIENINIEPVSSAIDISTEESVVNSSTNTSDKSLTGNSKDLKTDIVYEADNTLERGKRIEKNDVSGKKIIRIGTKPIVITEDIPSATIYVEDKNLNGGDTYEVISEDKSHNGKKSIVTLTYDLNKETGELIEHQSEPKIEYTEEKGKVIHVGTKKTTLNISEGRPFY